MRRIRSKSALRALALACGAVGALAAPTAASAAPTAWAVVRADGSLARGSGVFSAARFTVGAYTVNLLDVNVGTCGLVASLGSPTTLVVVPGLVGTARLSGTTGSVLVKTYYATGAPADRPFHLDVRCGAKKRFAVVGADGTLARGGGGATATRIVTGAYEVRFPRSVKGCAFTAVIGDPAVGMPPPGHVTTARRNLEPNAVFVETRAANGNIADLPFHLAVSCGRTQLWSVASAAGALVRGAHVTGVTRLAVGQYELRVDRVVSGCAFVATIGDVDDGFEEDGIISTAIRSQNPSAVYVLTQNRAGTNSDRDFHLALRC